MLSPALLGDHRAAQGISPCLRHRDRHSFPAKELLKEVGEAKGRKNPGWGTEGISWGAPSAGTKQCNTKKADLCQQCPKNGAFLIIRQKPEMVISCLFQEFTVNKMLNIVLIASKSPGK